MSCPCRAGWGRLRRACWGRSWRPGWSTATCMIRTYKEVTVTFKVTVTW